MDLVNDPRSVLELALNSREFQPVASRLDANSFVLKVVGKEEYFVKEVPIIQYKVCGSGSSGDKISVHLLSTSLQYIASCQAKKVQPRFSLTLYDDLRPKEKEEFIRPLHARPQHEGPIPYGRWPVLFKMNWLLCMFPSSCRRTGQSHIQQAIIRVCVYLGLTGYIQDKGALS